MKAIILERKGDFAAALREDGTVVKTRQAGEAGDEIELEAEIVRFPAQGKRWMRSAVAAALAVVILGGSFTYTVSASAYVSLDVGETGVELSVNRLGRVVAVKPASEDGTELAQALNSSLRGKRVEDALSETVAMLEEEGYLKDSGAAIIAGITSDTDQRGAALTEAVENAVTRSGGEDVPLYAVDVTPAERGEAREREISGGRYVFERDGSPEHGAPPEETPPPDQTEAQTESAVARPQTTAPPSPAGQRPGSAEEPELERGNDDPISTPAPARGNIPASAPIPTQDSIPAAAMPTEQPERPQPAETGHPEAGQRQEKPEDAGRQTEPSGQMAPGNPPDAGSGDMGQDGEPHDTGNTPSSVSNPGAPMRRDGTGMGHSAGSGGMRGQALPDGDPSP